MQMRLEDINREGANCKDDDYNNSTARILENSLRTETEQEKERGKERERRGGREKQRKRRQKKTCAISALARDKFARVAREIVHTLVRHVARAVLRVILIFRSDTSKHQSSDWQRARDEQQRYIARELSVHDKKARICISHQGRRSQSKQILVFAPFPPHPAIHRPRAV